MPSASDDMQPEVPDNALMRNPGLTAIANGDLYAAAYGTVRNLFEALRLEVIGEHNIPKSGSFLLASNHVSFLDPPLGGVTCTRRIHFFARKTLFRTRFSNWLLSALNALPIDRDGDSDIGAFRRIFALLKTNDALLVYPEGTRSPDGTLQPAKRGVGMIACRMQVPVVPLRIEGTFKMLSRQHKFPRPGTGLTAMFGHPIAPAAFDPGKDHPDRYSIAAELIMEAIRKLTPPKEPGV